MQTDTFSLYTPSSMASSSSSFGSGLINGNINESGIRPPVGGIPFISLSTRPLAQEPDPQSPMISPPPTPSPISLNSHINPHSNKRAYISPGLPPFKTSLVLDLCGEAISLDLDALDEDPGGLIRILEASECERDKWMIVAGAYRRKGEVDQAIVVVQKMIEVMRTRHKVSDENLKPAFLLLSACLTELARKSLLRTDGQTMPMPTERSNAAYEQARYWLQKVYGMHRPELDPPPTPASRSSDGVNGTGGENGRVRDLERELMVLRDRHSTYLSSLTSFRTSKRKTEDLLASERTKSARLTESLSAVQSQLIALQSEVKEMEGEMGKKEKRLEQALEQVKREVEERRRAEEREEQERSRRMESERTERRRAQQEVVRPLFEELAGIFGRAARADVDVEMARLELARFVDNIAPTFSASTGRLGEMGEAGATGSRG